VVTTVDEHVTAASDAERVEAMKERHRKDREQFADLLKEAAERAEEELPQEEEIRELLIAWDEEREALASAEADGLVAELEPVEEAADGPAVGAEGGGGRSGRRRRPGGPGWTHRRYTRDTHRTAPWRGLR
jgi:hypothetical protein